jgi:beta-glucanase (GH16 family)
MNLALLALSVVELVSA